MNDNISGTKVVKKKSSFRKFLHYLGRVTLGVVVALILFVITAKIMSGSNTAPPGEAMSVADNQKYIFGYVVVYGMFTLVLAGIAFFAKRFRATALTVIGFLVLGGLGGAAVLVYDTPALKRYDAVATANRCVALVSTPTGHGTGFSIKKGYLVTNYHVIEGAESVNVHYSADSVPAVVGFSKEMDIAVLKITEDIPTCRWADSESITAGTELYAVGWPYNPYGLPTTTKGIYSRSISANEAANLGLSNSEFIQTDTSINPGNSGGPLSNSIGVIGINSARLSFGDNTDIPEGIAYAIGSKSAQPFVDKTILDYEKK